MIQARMTGAKAPIKYGLVDPQVAGKMSGLEFLQAIIDGRLPAPPIGKTLGFRIAEVLPGRVVFLGTLAIDHYNPLGIVHGGYLVTLLDSAMGCAVQSRLPAGESHTTLGTKGELWEAGAGVDRGNSKRKEAWCIWGRGRRRPKPGCWMATASCMPMGRPLA